MKIMSSQASIRYRAVPGPGISRSVWSASSLLALSNDLDALESLTRSIPQRALQKREQAPHTPYAIAQFQAQKSREAYGVRRACWRFRRALAPRLDALDPSTGISKAGASSSHSIRYRGFGFGCAADHCGLIGRNSGRI